jgi:NADH-quinone oxidoreductase subunit I
VSSVAVTLWLGGWLRPFPNTLTGEWDTAFAVVPGFFFLFLAGWALFTAMRMPKLVYFRIQKLGLIGFGLVLGLIGLVLFVEPVRSAIGPVFWFIAKVGVFMHLVSGDVPALPFRSTYEVRMEVHDPAGNRSADPDGDSGCVAGADEGGARMRTSIKTFLRTIFLVDLMKGLALTFRYQHPKEIYTEQYPLERPQVAERYRGAPRLNVNPDTNETLCISCDLCALACPEHLIVVTSERNEATRRKELTTFTYDLSRCMFCGLCEDACPTDALELTQDFELANYSREGYIWDRQTLERGPNPTVYRK